MLALLATGKMRPACPRRDRRSQRSSVAGAACPGPPAGRFLVQPWCNQGGKDGNYGRNGQIAVNSIERMDIKFPQRQDGHPQGTIRSQFRVKYFGFDRIRTFGMASIALITSI
jgi:hypothetical protein